MHEPLRHGAYYRIYTRGNNRIDLFREARNYPYFLGLYHTHMYPVVETYAYCLLKNHFHLLVRVRDQTAKLPSKSFSNLLNAYARAFNTMYRRTDALFQSPFRRIPITSNTHLLRLVVYIHRNPQRHGMICDFHEWPHSSYHAMLARSPTLLQRDTTLTWFDGRAGFLAAHSISEAVDELDEL